VIPGIWKGFQESGREKEITHKCRPPGLKPLLSPYLLMLYFALNSTVLSWSAINSGVRMNMEQKLFTHLLLLSILLSSCSQITGKKIQAPTKPEKTSVTTKALSDTATRTANAAATTMVKTPAHPTPAGPITTEDICTSLNLSSEECANAGTHVYSRESTTSETCTSPGSNQTDTGQDEVTHDFFKGGVDVIYNQSSSICIKTGENIYQCDYSAYTCTLTFTENGVSWECGGDCPHQITFSRIQK
jgi:hypothetical protein